MKTFILIPPSEGKVPGGNNSSLHIINSITSHLIKEIRLADPKKLYGLKDKALNEAIEVNNNILISRILPAIERYSGVVFKAIDYSSLTKQYLFNKRVMILSALFGLISPKDNLPNYKLKIDKLKSAQLWKEENSQKLMGSFVIDLLPQAHRKAVFYENGIAVDFIIMKKGKKVPAGHNGKHIKGIFVRWLIENDITEVKNFSQFTEGGFVWDGNAFVKQVK